MNSKHGHAFKGRVTRTYHCWQNMKKRCYTPSTVRFERWGGRGTSVCDPWLQSFANFLRDMGECPPKHSLDRINNDKNYTPLNCRGATNSEQVLNSKHARFIAHKGQSKAISEWAKELGMDHRTLWNGFKLGRSIERALTQPKRKFLEL